MKQEQANRPDKKSPCRKSLRHGRDRLRIAHHHEPVGLRRPQVGGVDIIVFVVNETVAFVESATAARNFVFGRIDLQDDAPRTTAQVVQNARTVIVPAQNGFDGQMFEVGVAFVGEPPEDQPHEQVAVPHALGIQAAVGERGVVVPFAAALARRERSFVKSVRRSPAGVGGGEESPVCQCFHRR